ncbi:hypothetical protein BDP27DRAFT_1367739 [Rhodocollybia butyracea]|uniref:Uncharacterized protein n=1 Tax=Rhodocollybia butyracea TaxID=206335 RepID=A0A9P5PEI6_9AGAR|nr:hypothetical protein BDP27DRAFT_1367739 [Rhodocollybia butyracea]
MYRGSISMEVCSLLLSNWRLGGRKVSSLFPAVSSVAMAVIDSDKEKIPPLSLRTSHALAYAKRELRMALFSKDAEDLLAVNAELKAVEDLYATTTEHFEINNRAIRKTVDDSYRLPSLTKGQNLQNDGLSTPIVFCYPEGNRGKAPVIQPVNVMSVDGDKLYVVYWGHNDMDLITSNWHGIAGAKNATHGLTNAIHRRFLGPKLGAAAYKECRTTGILAALKDKMANKHFIVVKGENPGVYVRQTVVSKGLKWHGGEIICLIGNAKDAQDLFKHLEREPMTVSLPQDLHWGIARDLNTSFCIDLGVLEPKHQLCLAAFVTPNIELN